MKINIKKEKGFTTIDLSIAMMVVAIFVAIMGSMMYTTYTISTEARRTATALNYAVDICEQIGVTNLSVLSAEGVLRDLEAELEISSIRKTKDTAAEQIAVGTIGTYDIELKIENTYPNKIKKCTVTIRYKVSAKKPNEEIVIERIRVRD